MPNLPAILFKQGDNTLIDFSMNASELIKFAYYNPRELDREEGIQRDVKIRKLKEIAAYIESDNPVLANNIIINLQLNRLDLEVEDIFDNYHILFDKIYDKAEEKKIEKFAFVIDGQHRLRSFEYTDKDFPLNITAIINLSLAEVAEIFVKINYYQRPINKSHALDLLGISKEIFPEFYHLHNVVKKLNEDYESPFCNSIKMLGKGEGFVSQASFISALEKYKVIQTMENIGIPNDDEEMIYSILWIYFCSIKKTFSVAWGNKEYYLTKTVGIRSLIKLLKDFLITFTKKDIVFSIEDVDEKFSSINISLWKDAKVSTLIGEKGVNDLFRILKEKIGV